MGRRPILSYITFYSCQALYKRQNLNQKQQTGDSSVGRALGLNWKWPWGRWFAPARALFFWYEFHLFNTSFLRILHFTPKVKYSGPFFWVQLKTKSFFVMVYAMSACEAADIAKPNEKWFSFQLNPEKRIWILIILMEVTPGTWCHSRVGLLGRASIGLG